MVCWRKALTVNSRVAGEKSDALYRPLSDDDPHLVIKDLFSELMAALRSKDNPWRASGREVTDLILADLEKVSQTLLYKISFDEEDKENGSNRYSARLADMKRKEGFEGFDNALKAAAQKWEVWKEAQNGDQGVPYERSNTRRAYEAFEEQMEALETMRKRFKPAPPLKKEHNRCEQSKKKERSIEDDCVFPQIKMI